MKTQRESATLQGHGGSLEMDLEDFCNALLTLEDLGWQPEQSRLNYLAVGAVVSEQDAANLARAADSVFMAISNNSNAVTRPISFQKLLEFGAFCLKGGFKIVG
jgi:hypothetical protein